MHTNNKFKFRVSKDYNQIRLYYGLDKPLTAKNLLKTGKNAGKTSLTKGNVIMATIGIVADITVDVMQLQEEGAPDDVILATIFMPVIAVCVFQFIFSQEEYKQKKLEKQEKIERRKRFEEKRVRKEEKRRLWKEKK